MILWIWGYFRPKFEHFRPLTLIILRYVLFIVVGNDVQLYFCYLILICYYYPFLFFADLYTKITETQAISKLCISTIGLDLEIRYDFPYVAPRVGDKRVTSIDVLLFPYTGNSNLVISNDVRDVRIRDSNHQPTFSVINLGDSRIYCRTNSFVISQLETLPNFHLSHMSHWSSIMVVSWTLYVY